MTAPSGGTSADYKEIAATNRALDSMGVSPGGSAEIAALAKNRGVGSSNDSFLIEAA